MYSYHVYTQSEMPLANSTPMQGDTSNISKYVTDKSIRKEESSKKSAKYCVANKKPIVVKNTTTKAIKPVSNNQNGVNSVERILVQIKMTKYKQMFKNYSIAKFKHLSELDLNAMGITRPQEVRIFKEAIHKAKVDNS